MERKEFQRKYRPVLSDVFKRTWIVLKAIIFDKDAGKVQTMVESHMEYMRTIIAQMKADKQR